MSFYFDRSSGTAVPNSPFPGFGGFSSFTGMAENAIVSRVLYCRIRGDNVEFENYEEWRIQVKTYLLGQGLCDVIVKAKAKGSKGLNNYNNKAIWKKKNAAALHAIQICCGSVAFSLIKNITSSKTAWATLARKYKEQQQNSRKQDNQEEKKEIEEGFQSQAPTESRGAEFGNNRPFFDAVISGNWEEAEEFIKQNEHVLKATIPNSGKNALHVAISAGHVHIVEKLVDLMSPDELEVRREDDLTVLHAAVETGNIKIAQCLVNKNEKLTVLCSRMDDIERHRKVVSRFNLDLDTPVTYSPVLQAVIYGETEMAHYLYSVTSKEFLQKEKNHPRLYSHYSMHL